MSEPDRPYEKPYQCTPPEFGGCGRVHTHKTHHLNLDEAGAAIIGDVLYEKVKAYLFAYGFREANIVEKPPALGIGLLPATRGNGHWGDIPIIKAEGD
jgi:hypothetical protein